MKTSTYTLTNPQWRIIRDTLTDLKWGTTDEDTGPSIKELDAILAALKPQRVPKKPKGYPPTPTLDRMLTVKAESQAQGELIEWLRGHVVDHWSIEQILAKFHGIDLAAVEDERETVLEWHRKQNP